MNVSWCIVDICGNGTDLLIFYCVSFGTFSGMGSYGISLGLFGGRVLSEVGLTD